MFEVIVGNIGRVHSGEHEVSARREFNHYARLARQGYGRYAYEGAVLLRDGEIIKECPAKQQD